MFSKKHIVSLSLVAAFAVNNYAYEAGIGATDNGTASNTATGQNATATGLSNSTSYGAFSKALANEATAYGAYTEASGISSIVYGAQSSALGDYSTSIGGLTTSSASFSVALGRGSVANESYVVSVGRGVENGDIVDSFKRIVNVADPINAHDAVNLNYLNTTLSSYYTKTQVDTLLAGLSGGSVDLSSAYTYTDTKASQTLQSAKAYTDEQITEAKKEARAGVALALALSTPLDFSNGKSAMNIGTGYYKGESAVGLNFGRKVNDYTHYTFGIASNGGEQAFKASVGFSW